MLTLSYENFRVNKEDELTCLITGCNFLLKNISDEAFVYNRNGSPEYEFQTADPHVFPYMLVNIGSGVSILKVESDSCYERIGGTATGGGTFWGLGTLLTKAKSFEELLDLAEKGDHRKADMLVKDIYGGDYETLGMHSDLIASSFGKICPRQNAGIRKVNRTFFFDIHLLGFQKVITMKQIWREVYCLQLVMTLVKLLVYMQ